MRRALKIASVVLAGAVLLLGGEAVLALSKDYPLSDPDLPVRGDFGDPSLPRFKFVVIGDSTAVGVGTTPDKSFPWLIASRLGEKRHVDLEVVGFGGATTKALKGQVDRALALKPDLVLIEIGANDTTHATPPWTVHKLFGNALDRLIASGTKVVVAGPPDMGEIPTVLQPLKELAGLLGDTVMRIVEKQARARNLPYVNLARGVEQQTLPPGVSYYSSDNFHPGEGGYGLWAKVMYPAVAAEADRVERRVR